MTAAELTADIDSRLTEQTAFRSLDALRDHMARGGRAPSFQRRNVEGVRLANDLLMLGVICTIYT